MFVYSDNIKITSISYNLVTNSNCLYNKKRKIPHPPHGRWGVCYLKAVLQICDPLFVIVQLIVNTPMTIRVFDS